MSIFTAIKFNFSTLLVGMFLAAVVGYLIGYFLRKLISQYQLKEAEARKIKIIEEAEQEVRNRFQAAVVEGKEQALVEKEKTEKEVQVKWEELRGQERRVHQKEDELRLSKVSLVDFEKELTLRMKEAEKTKQSSLDEKSRYEALAQEEMKKLESISSFTAEQAIEEIKAKVVDLARLDAAKEVKKIEEDAQNNAEEEARKIITMAVQRLALIVWRKVQSLWWLFQTIRLRDAL